MGSVFDDLPQRAEDQTLGHYFGQLEARGDRPPWLESLSANLGVERVVADLSATMALPAEGMLDHIKRENAAAMQRMRALMLPELSAFDTLKRSLDLMGAAPLERHQRPAPQGPLVVARAAQPYPQQLSQSATVPPPTRGRPQGSTFVSLDYLRETYPRTVEDLKLKTGRTPTQWRIAKEYGISERTLRRNLKSLSDG